MALKTEVNTIADWINSKYFILVLVFLGLGMVFSGFFGPMRAIVGLLLGINMFVLALNCRLDEFRQIGVLWKKLALILLIIYGLVPLFALTLGKAVLPSEMSLAAGLVLISILPVAMSSAFWTETANGNLPLTLSIITVTTLLSGLLIPILMQVYVGKAIDFDASGLVAGLSKTVIAPVFLGLLARHYFPSPTKVAKPYLDVGIRVIMLVTVSINAAVIVPYVKDMGWNIAIVIGAILVHILASYIIGYIFAMVAFPHDPDMRISIAYTSGMRNNSAGIVIALAYFPPLVAVPVILSILLQQPMAALLRPVIEKSQRAVRPIGGQGGFRGR